MLDHGLDEGPAEIGDHIEGIAAGDGEPLQVDGEEDQQHDRHTEGGHVAQEQERGEQDLVEALADIGGKGTQDIAQQPADDDRRELQAHGPHDRVAYDITYGTGVLAERGAEIALQGILGEAEELLMHGQVGAEFFLEALVDLLDCGGIGHALGHLAGDGGDGIHRHHPGQEEVQDHGHHEGDGEPQQLFAKILTVTFHWLSFLPVL